MTPGRINIKNFQDQDVNQIYSHLMLANEKEFEVCIPKGICCKGEDVYSKFYEYYYASYAGERLSEIACGFSYWVPPPNSTTPFIFHCEFPEINKFAAELCYIVSGYYGLSPERNGHRFEDHISRYYKAAQSNILSAACWGLLVHAIDFKNKWDDKRKIRMKNS